VVPACVVNGRHRKPVIKFAVAPQCRPAEQAAVIEILIIYRYDGIFLIFLLPTWAGPREEVGFLCEPRDQCSTAQPIHDRY
jgi:hypothetical protein